MSQNQYENPSLAGYKPLESHPTTIQLCDELRRVIEMLRRGDCLSLEYQRKLNPDQRAAYENGVPLDKIIALGQPARVREDEVKFVEARGGNDMAIRKDFEPSGVVVFEKN